MKLIAITSLLLLLLTGPLMAQEAPVAEPAGAKAFLAGLTGFDEGVCGETELSLLMAGSAIGS